MIEYKEYVNALNEALITFGGKSYPKFGQVVLMAGGAGSGKGFVKEKILGIEGKLFDVDELKKKALESDKFSKRIKDETGEDISKYDLRNPEDVGMIHKLLSDVYGLPNKNQATVFKGLTTDPEKLPNLIFDVTLKDIKKLSKISSDVLALGYDISNIHIVWVVNDVKVAIEQNSTRDRVVPIDILIGTHKGAASTMDALLKSGDEIKKYMDGDIWLAFNKRGSDSQVKTIKKGNKTYEYTIPSTPVQVKKRGKPQKTLKELDKVYYDKVKSYIPQSIEV